MTLSLAAMMDEARTLTGLTAFGPELFVEGAERLVQAVNDEAALTEIGVEAQRARITGLLVNRLRLEQSFTQHPEILDQTIPAPLVIVGLPRTGSTMTHRLLASDPDHTAMIWWEGRHPAMLPGEVRGQPDERRALGRAEVEAVMAASPEAGDIHPWDYEGADEEVLLLEHTFMSSTPEAFMNVPSYSAWVEAQDHVAAYGELKRMLQGLQWQNPGREQKRWVLKSPHHLGYVDALLEVFPDASIIQTHRSPMQTVPSFCSMCANLAEPLTDDPDAATIGSHWAHKLARALAHCMHVSDAQPERFLHLHFKKMVVDPIAEMTALYEFAGETFGDRAEAAMRAYREDDAHQPGAHQYSLESYGLSEALIAELYADYIHRFELG